MCSPAFLFHSLTENAIMNAFARVQCALHQQVSVWHSARMYVSPHRKETVCVHVHLVVCAYVCSRFEAVFMLSCD